ncbi:hypothetical protein ABZ508_09865 [Streptomyces lavendulocolor]|uniref:Uncharacterized protein n=1 Tax=Streptomyces lavendulocolor TaxID=67316 RepID=A0ABV2W295_9ACTN|nr:hypothetical protein GCM10018771_67400 [Streptomyces cellulosae]
MLVAPEANQEAHSDLLLQTEQRAVRWLLLLVSLPLAAAAASHPADVQVAAHRPGQAHRRPMARPDGAR